MAQEKWLIHPGESKTIDCEVVRTLKISLVGGHVDVIGHDEPNTRIEVHSVSAKELKISIDGDTLEIDHPQLRWDNFIDAFRNWNGKAKADISVLVPRKVALKFGVVSASALIAGIEADAKISTVSGEVTIDEHNGSLELNAVNGELSVHNHVGKVSAHTVSGDVTVVGELRKFSADSVSGNIYADLSGVPDQIDTNAVSGDLTLRLDAGVGARFRLNTVAGTMHVDDTVYRGSFGKGITHESGPLSGRWAEVSVNSVSGNMSVVRRAAPASESSESVEEVHDDGGQE